MSLAEENCCGNRFINQLCLAVTGGPGGVQEDGWLTAYNVGTSGMLHKDSVEIDEWKHPIRVIEQRLIPTRRVSLEKRRRSAAEG